MTRAIGIFAILLATAVSARAEKVPVRNPTFDGELVTDAGGCALPEGWRRIDPDGPCPERVPALRNARSNHASDVALELVGPGGGVKQHLDHELRKGTYLFRVALTGLPGPSCEPVLEVHAGEHRLARDSVRWEPVDRAVPEGLFIHFPVPTDERGVDQPVELRIACTAPGKIQVHRVEVEWFLHIKIGVD